MKKIFIAATILICTICAGCLQAESDLTITDDGKIFQRSKILGNALVIRHIEDWKVQTEKNNPGVKGNLIVEGDLRGYEFNFEYPDLETFDDSGDGLNKKISRHAGWFFDVCDFDFYFETPPADIPPEAQFMIQSAFSNVEFNFSIKLPYSAEKNNADEISADGKILKWNLAPVLIHGGEKSMHVQFKLWHKNKIALTAAVELLLLAATIFFFRKARAEEFVDLRKDLIFKRNVFAGLFVALTIISAYMFLAPITFTNADIISVAVP